MTPLRKNSSWKFLAGPLVVLADMGRVAHPSRLLQRMGFASCLGQCCFAYDAAAVPPFRKEQLFRKIAKGASAAFELVPA
jgi:hypothetical protein